MVGDPIGDFLIQIKNAGAIKKPFVVVPYSKLKHSVALLLVKEGYLESAIKKGKGIKKSLEVALNYKNGIHKIKGVKRMSKPSRRIYSNHTSIPTVRGGFGSFILSTPKGILSDKSAREKHVGGELLFKIW